MAHRNGRAGIGVHGGVVSEHGWGLSLALLQHSFTGFYARSKKQVELGVDSQNLTGATRLYEKAGVRVHQQLATYDLELRPGEEISKQA